MECKALIRLSIPSGVRKIEDETFRDCLALKEIGIPEGATRFGDGAFEGCAALEYIWIPGSVTDLGGDVFYGCRRLSQIDVSAGNGAYKSVGNAVFSRDGRRLIAYPPGRRRARHDVPGEVGEILAGAFDGAPVRTVVVRRGVKIISGYATRREDDPYFASEDAEFVVRMGKPIYPNKYATGVDLDGNIRYGGSNVRNNGYCVRPALWLRLE